MKIVNQTFDFHGKNFQKYVQLIENQFSNWSKKQRPRIIPRPLQERVMSLELTTFSLGSAMADYQLSYPRFTYQIYPFTKKAQNLRDFVPSWQIPWNLRDSNP